MSEFWHDAALPQLEARRSWQDAACYRPHSHDRFSIGLIDAGSTTFTGADGRPVPLAAGDVILVPAGHVHSCNPDQGRWEYGMIHADQDWVAGLLAAGADALLAGITVLRAPGAYRPVRAVEDLLFAPGDGRPVDGALVEEALRHALGACATTPPHRRIAPTTDDALLERLRPVLARLHEDASNPALDELAAVAGMDRYALVRTMKRATGLTPVSWRHNDRVTSARAMLRAGRPLADTAHALGFADQSHFHRVFRAHVAATPGAYRR
ncbi:AraC family transcriptional regulator [Isoptericola sp. NPDC056618]|uniref:helix-turn-helix transcriptional regulator n=1 Tax=Isoptericola sp. NPDC056618 TaxID=3345878 RepID=UPI0036BF0E1F